MAALAPSDNTTFFRLGVTVPTYVAGTILNGYLVSKYFRHKHILVVSTLDRIVYGLAATCLVWSIISTLRTVGAYLLESGSIQSGIQIGSIMKLSSIDITTSITILLGLHSLLALERYFILRKEDSPENVSSLRIWMATNIIFMITVIFSAAYLVISSPNDKATWPENITQRTIWTIVVSTGFAVNLTVIVYCYTSTFYYMRNKLKEVIRNYRTNQIRVIVEREVFFNCAIMSGAVFVSYIPQVIFAILLVTGALDPDSTTAQWFNVIQFQFIALDSVISPLLVIYFMKPSNRVSNAKREFEFE